MGYMYFGNQSHELEIDDRPLTHLKIALLSMLRAGHSVAFSIQHPVSAGGGRETFWITPHTDLRFKFIGGRSISISEEWVKLLIASASSPAGMRLCPEPISTRAHLA
ncbi:DUF7882 family protein [Pseudoclavibacter terrae]|uniref:ATP-dependent DNA ligase n=1 Tax=Pseudoclavibacter terrae TaxID=1530195 RepID=A0A7J5AXE4_9MICO|nr:ATP-dependent DNA ligase [Pseudoclavibacter terrae]KAB1636055.1 ATP-dependent DNA ligase [Pseudoclavibacter terrae]